MKKIYILLTLLAVMAVGCTKVPETAGPEPVTDQFDPAFAAELQKRGYIADAQHITPDEVAAITELDLSADDENGDPLRSLRGIEYFSALQVLSCNGHQLEELDLQANTALVSLNCNHNWLTTLDLSHNPALTTLHCQGNDLTELNVNGNPALVTLNCSWNDLTSLDVSHNTALETLICNDNALTALDLSHNTALTSLNCHSNVLSWESAEIPCWRYWTVHGMPLLPWT